MPGEVPVTDRVESLLGSQYELALRAGARSVHAVITEVGAAIRQLCVDGVAITHTFDEHHVPPFFCGAVLVPWPNRVRDGRWVHEGCTHQLEVNDRLRGNALHGLLCDVPYRVVARSGSSITLGAQVMPRPGYPFHLDTEVCYRLTPDGLAVTHTVRNIGSTRAPVAIGAHPFPTIGGVPGDSLRLTVNALQHIDTDHRLIPIGLRTVPGTDWDLRGGRLVADLNLDDTWTDLCPTGGGSVHSLRAPDGRTVSLWADAGFGFVHVFITREFPRAGELVTAVALEPMTAPANALNTGDGLRWLAPAQDTVSSWAIRYDDGAGVRG
ncbi:aldose 1-epimerase family protein [Mycolicibacterium diernhoferi]|uniref:Aldose epimerase n=1 Tax=Mycolicibacterium diernhoferi TaxID=1801 RepID=A0A2A7NPP5_9MYCO|nr:aldose epimerase [Mycolicibacterium diernhoferi]QYL24275.1 aldose 1-epimerase family protein [Mycolicibacterium diernhoferi]